MGATGWLSKRTREFNQKVQVQPAQVISFIRKEMFGRLYSTCASPVVPHLSTRHAHGCLASEIGRDPAFPTRYDRTENSSRVASPDSGAAATRPRSRKRMKSPRSQVSGLAVGVCEGKANTDPTTKA